MEKFNRAVRRHHVERLKKARKLYWYPASLEWSYPLKKIEGLDPKRLGKVVSTPKACSCWLCNRPRKVFGLTIKEQSFNEFFKKVEDDDTSAL